MAKHPEESRNGMVLVMGVTGAGKSHFINKLKPGAVEVGHGLESMTSKPQAVQIFWDEQQEASVTIVDTPGFDDTYRSDGEILAQITGYLAAQYAANIPLHGIIYLHRITDKKMKGSSRRYLDIFRSLCGDHALGNVILVTTCWDTVQEEEMGDLMRLEQELIDKFWAPMLNKGSYVTQFDGSRDAAEALVLELVHGRESVVLDIQKELVDRHKEVGETAAGQRLGRHMEEEAQYYRDRITRLDTELEDAVRRQELHRVDQLRGEKEETKRGMGRLEKSQRKMQARVGDEMKVKIDKEKKTRHGALATGISIFASVLSITLTVVKLALGGI